MKQQVDEGGLEWISLGCCGYEEARAMQLKAVEQRQRGEIGDRCYFLEHPPVITFGKQSLREGRISIAAEAASGIDLVHTDRGGQATYHGPGQWVIYPVVSLRERSWGVKEFVHRGLQAIADVVKSFELPAELKLDPAGVWVRGGKLASVGLKIQGGVSNHGFSFNVTNSLEPYEWFSPCGLSREQITTLASQLRIAPELSQSLKQETSSLTQLAFQRYWGQPVRKRTVFEGIGTDIP